MTQLFIDKQFEELLPLINERNREDGLMVLHELSQDVESGLSDPFINAIRFAVETSVHVPMIFPYAGGLGFSFLFVDEEDKGGGIDIDVDDDSPYVIVTINSGDGSEVYETHPLTELTGLFNKLGAIQKVNERVLTNIKQLLQNRAVDEISGIRGLKDMAE